MHNTIKEIPLLFQTEMVQAVVEDRKTQTRRTKGLESKNEHPNAWNREGNPCWSMNRLWDSTQEKNPNPLKIEYGFRLNDEPDADIVYQRCPYGKPGDLLWVRETHKVGAWREDGRVAYNYKASPELVNTPWVTFEYDYTGEKFERLQTTHTDFLLNKGYKSDQDGFFHWEAGKSPFPWKPSIYMPKVAARIWLMVEEIRVERLQEISEEDAIAEGVDFAESSNGKTYKDYLLYPNDVYEWYNSPKRSFESLWKSINGRESWNQNPWVWVIEFRVLSKTGRPSDDVIQQNRKEVANG